MPRTFGRRTPPPRPTLGGIAPPRAEFLAGRESPVPPILPADDGVDREIEEWKAARRLRRRSFREPWRSVSIAAAIGFGLSSWLLPDSVAGVAQLVTLGLSVASFAAGFRRPAAR